jgi:hypothetical protein
MAQGTFFKTFGSSDKTTTRTLLHESIPITGTLVSGTYSIASTGREDNIKSFSHGMFQSVFDYPFLSSSANHIFDITVGIKSGSAAHENITSQKEKKGNIYSQMAQMLVGYDTDSNVRDFDEDGNLSDGSKIDQAVFLNFSRLLVKDEIKKGSFSMDFGIDAAYSNQGKYPDFIRISDQSGSDGYRVNSPAGEYGVLFANSPNSGSATHSSNWSQLTIDPTTSGTPGAADTSENGPVGLIFYQAGIIALSSSIFTSSSAGGSGYVTSSLQFATSSLTGGPETAIEYLMSSSNVDIVADAMRNRIQNISFNNTTELNSTIYFCRANHNEFNYSSNPTYLNGSKIRVKNDDIMVPPRSYATTVGLYSSNNELLAVAKLSEPLKKDPSNELTLRVRLDY